jgi:8-oxo-dGTP diphosphatase
VGGTLEWGETFREAIPRVLAEEAGASLRSIGRLVGVFARPDRVLRFHAVTIVVECEVDLPSRPPANPLEIQEVALFTDAELPRELAMGTGDMIAAARRGAAEPVLE